jgi:hypothetical protein
MSFYARSITLALILTELWTFVNSCLVLHAMSITKTTEGTHLTLNNHNKRSLSKAYAWNVTDCCNITTASLNLSYLHVFRIIIGGHSPRPISVAWNLTDL